MYKLFLTSLMVFLTIESFAACDDQPPEVDWTNCNFSENLDLSGAGLANSQMSGVNLSLSNFEKSQINNSNLSIGNFIFSNFNNANLYASNLQGANCNNSTFDNANLAKVNFEGANLFGATFKGANLYEANLLGANVSSAIFDEANLSNAIWIDGKKCALGSIGSCQYFFFSFLLQVVKCQLYQKFKKMMKKKLILRSWEVKKQVFK